MISHYRQNVLEESLFTHIYLQSSLLIATDGAKGKGKSGEGWVLALDNGHHIIEEYNPNFGQSNKITSYRSEAYAVLSATLFLHHYCKFFVYLLIIRSQQAVTIKLLSINFRDY